MGVGFVLDGKPRGRYLHGFDWITASATAASIQSFKPTQQAVDPAQRDISFGTGVCGFFLHDELLASRRTKVAGGASSFIRHFGT